MFRQVSRMIVLNMILLVACIGLLYAGPLRTPGDVLKTYGIGVDESSLITALSDRRAVVRGLAAYQLAGDDMTDAIPYLIEAFRAEKDVNTKFNIAQSLHGLGSPEGTKALRHYCKDTGKPENIRSEAAYDLGPAGSESCIGIVTPNLLSENPSARQSALLYLKRLTRTPASAPAGIGAALVRISTEDPLSSNRELARAVIEKIGDEKTKKALDQATEE